MIHANPLRLIQAHGTIFQASAVGIEAPIVEMKLLNNQQALRRRIMGLPRLVCIAPTVQIVLDDGRVLGWRSWDTIAQACSDAGLYLIIDEAMTAFRCGAPFAHMRPEYGVYKPPFVIFGKGLQLSGIAAFCDGVTFSKRGLDREMFSNLVVRNCIRSSELVKFVNLLESLAVIRLARKGAWTERSKVIGTNLHRYLSQLQPGVKLGGLDSLIYLPWTVNRIANMDGAGAGKLVRWIPLLDDGMYNPACLDRLFGPRHGEIRRQLEEAMGDSVGFVTSVRILPTRLRIVQAATPHFATAAWKARHATRMDARRRR